MRTKNPARISITVVMGTTLLLALGRCSPLAPSLQKGVYSGMGHSQSPTSELLTQQETARTQNSNALEHATEVVSGQMFVEKISEFTSDNQMITLSEDQVSGLLQTGSADFIFEKELSGKTLLLLEVKGSESEIEQLELDQFKTYFVIHDQGRYSLTVRSNVDKDVRELMKLRLIQATLVVLSNASNTEKDPQLVAEKPAIEEEVDATSAKATEPQENRTTKEADTPVIPGDLCSRTAAQEVFHDTIHDMR